MNDNTNFCQQWQIIWSERILTKRKEIMNKARIFGILLLLVGVFLLYRMDNSDDGYAESVLTGAISAAGLVLILMGRFKFWEKM